MISRRELRRNKLHIQKPFIPKSIRRGEDYTGSSMFKLYYHNLKTHIY